MMIQETQGRRVYVLGEVRTPGFYKLPMGGTDVMSAIALASGFTDDAARDGTIIVRITLRLPVPGSESGFVRYAPVRARGDGRAQIVRCCLCAALRLRGFCVSHAVRPERIELRHPHGSGRLQHLQRQRREILGGAMGIEQHSSVPGPVRQRGLGPREVILILFRRRFVVLAVALPIILAVGGSLLSRTGTFTAASRVLVELMNVDQPRWNINGPQYRLRPRNEHVPQHCHERVGGRPCGNGSC
ncbi:MAG: SLBB domain-containing protein [bacterium]|nr:SLBB domain-containing protein [bacterium]